MNKRRDMRQILRQRPVECALRIPPKNDAPVLAAEAEGGADGRVDLRRAGDWRCVQRSAIGRGVVFTAGQSVL